MLYNNMIRKSEKRSTFSLILAIFLAVVFLFFSLSVSFLDKLYDFFKVYTTFPVVEILINFVFLLLLVFLWLTFHLWQVASLKLHELENILDNINPDVLLIVDEDRNVRMCNNSVQRMFGFKTDEIIGKKTDYLYFDRRTNPEQKHEIYYVLEREGFHIGLATGRKKDGGTIPLEIITGNLGGREGAVLLLRDISMRKRSEMVLKESEARHSILLNSIKSPIVALGDDMSILYCNESFGKIIGMPADQLEWKNLMSVYPSIRRTQFFDAFMKVFQNGKTIEVSDKLGDWPMDARIYPTPWGILSVFDKALGTLENEVNRENPPTGNREDG